MNKEFINNEKPTCTLHMRMKQKCDSDSNFSTSNIILEYGEIACVLDPNKKLNKIVNMKIGDGITPYNDLDYIFVTEDQFEDQLQKYQSEIRCNISCLNDDLRYTNNFLLHKIENLRKNLISFCIIQIITIALFAFHLYFLH